MAKRVPATVLGHEVPVEFRRRRMHLESPVAVLADFIAWLDAAGVERVDGGGPSRGADASAQAESERERLVGLCADLHDRLSSEGLRDKLRHGLAQVGVELLRADGEVFDPDRHEAAGQVPTTERALHDRVASTQRVGWSDRGRPGREPLVLVYCLEGLDDGG